MQIEFTAKVQGNSEQGYKIHIPKNRLGMIPDGTWMVKGVRLSQPGFIQELGPHSISKATKSRFIPIYKDEVIADYPSMGRMNVTLLMIDGDRNGRL